MYPLKSPTNNVNINVNNIILYSCSKHTLAATVAHLTVIA